MGRKFYLNIGFQVLMAVIIIIGVRWHGGCSATSSWAQTGQKLLAAGLWRPAAQAYERYLTTQQDPAAAYSLAEIYAAHQDDESALTWLYHAETLLASTKLTKKEREELRPKINQQLVALLEKAGKSASAAQAMAARTSLNTPVVPANAKVIAEVGDTKIYDYQIQERLNDIQKVFGDKNVPDKKLVIQDLVTTELFWQKALRLGLDQDAQVKEKVASAQKAVVLERLLQDEAKQKVLITENDLQNYYQAHKEEYKDPKTKKVLPFAKVKSAVQAAYQQQKTQELMALMAEDLAKQIPVKMHLENIP